jgi:UDP-N-acetylmuramyl pentapeptide phosphotransferase/UDP-N-acetylglucosamine-1-phosphate transferase
VAQAAWAIWIAAHAAIAVAGTWLARRYALRHRLLDQPGERRSHQVPTPRGGGIAIVASMLSALAWIAIRNPLHAPLLAATGVGCALVAGIGWLDDHRPLPAWPRLLVQCVAAALLAWGLRQDGASMGVVIAAFFAALVLVNVWNFMDGIDGLAASQALLVAAAYGLLAGQGIVALFAFALVGGCLGFLPFNAPRARIFLGDVGSGTLGFAIAALAAWLAIQDKRAAPVLLLPLSAFLVDASLTLAARVLRRQRWWLPHSEHAYQHWARLRGHLPVTKAYAAWTLLACAAMLAVRDAAPAFMMAVLFVVYLAGTVGWASLRRMSQGREDTRE